MTALLLAALAVAAPDENALLQRLADGPPDVVAADLSGLPSAVGGIDLHHDADVATWVGAWTGPLRQDFRRWLGRLDRDRDTLEFLLAGEGLPPGLALVPLVESGLLPEATSTTGCAGTWQLAAPTAIALGLRVRDGADDRRDPLLSAAAAAQLLRELIDRFGRWDLALAAYNAGPARVAAAVDEAGATDWPSVAGRLPDEPRHFVAKVHAALLVDAHRARFGIEPVAP